MVNIISPNCEEDSAKIVIISENTLLHTGKM